MPVLEKALGVACCGLLVAGAAGVATRSAPTDRGQFHHRTLPPPTGSSTTTPSAPAPGSAQLASGLITPTDMGGYYRTDQAAGTATADSALCLAALQPSPAQQGRAVSSLLGPGSFSMPTIVEVLASYRGGEAAAVYQAATRSVTACGDLSMNIGGGAVRVPLGAASIPPVGDRDQVWAGTFTYSGHPFSLRLGLVLTGPVVLGLIWVDSVPSSNPIMGDFPSTLSLAIGKIAA